VCLVVKSQLLDRAVRRAVCKSIGWMRQRSRICGVE